MKRRIFLFAALILALCGALLGGCSTAPAPKRVTVNFLNYDGALLYATDVEEGEVPVYAGETPSRPTQSGVSYTFAGWELDGYVYTELPAVRRNTQFTASFEEAAAQYTVTFSVGATRTEQTYRYGETPVYSGPTEVEHEGVACFIAGWDKPFAPVTEDTVYTAILEPLDSSVLITFDVDGEQLSMRLQKGEIPRFFGTPYRERTDTESYRFTGWMAGGQLYTGTLPAATEDTVYVAQFECVERNLTVRFLDSDGELLFETQTRYGERPVYGGEELFREGNEMYDYRFLSWDLDGEEYPDELPAVYEDCSFAALYRKVYRTYRLTVEYYDGETLVSRYEDTVTAGNDYYVETPAREGKYAPPCVRGVITSDTALTVHYTVFSEWDGTSAAAFSGGTGSVSNPHLIGSAQELALLATRSESSDFSGNYFALTCDIDLKGLAWKPIGSNARPFAGTFDGRGHLVTGLHRESDLPNSNLANSGHGLFSTSKGTVKELCVSGYVRSVARYTGVVVGYNQGRVENCTAYGNVYGFGNVGGVVGYSTGTVTGCVNYAEVHDINSADCYRFGGVVGTASGDVLSCINYGAVRVHSGSGRVGGIVGHVDNSASVTDCVNYGYVRYEKKISSGTMTYTGGCVGITEGKIVARCINYGTVEGADRLGGVLGWTRPTPTEDCKNFGAVIGTQYIGGVVGVTRSTVSRSENHGTVRATASNCGGIAGTLLGSAFDCVNYGNMYSTSTSFGGIAGQLNTEAGMKEARIRNCKNYGKLTGSATSENVTTGGIAGRADSLVDSKIYACIEGCENHGKVVAHGSYVGGVVGACNGGQVSTSKNYAVVDGGTGAYVGGIAGSNYGYGTVEKCENYGIVIGGSTIGGICGQLTSTSTAPGNLDNGKTLSGKN